MSGSSVPTTKLPWRQKVRRFWPSKSSAPAPSTTHSPASTTQNIVPSGVLSTVTSVPSPSAKPLARGQSALASTTAQLLQDALQRLPDAERTTIDDVVSSSIDIRSAIQDAISAAQKQRQICLDKRWSLTIAGKSIVLREKADKIVHWLDRFKSVGDVVANADPIHVGLPWAGIRLLLEVAVAESNQMAALLVGCETTLYMASRLEAYLAFWQSLPATATRRNLEESIVIMYAYILRFLARAIHVYQSSTVRRAASALWSIDDVADFEERASDLAMKVELDASTCDRTVSVRQQKMMAQLQQDMLAAVAELQQQRQLQATLDQLHLKIDLDKIPYAKGAMFGSSDGVHAPCHPATRRDILSQVQTWAQQPEGTSIFWLYGGAGAGKSTISWTTAQWLSGLRGSGGVDLGASFFFKRGEGDRGSATRFFPTIVRQLITKIPGLDVLVTRAMDSDPFIFDKALAEQFRRLVLHPLQDLTASNTHRPILVVVVDALDECQKETDIKIILELWSQLSHLKCVRLRLFLTSRPELTIRLGFQQIPNDRFRDVDLVDAVPITTIQDDLFIYLTDSFHSIRNDHNRRLPGVAPLSTDWANRDQVQQLVKMAAPLFIVAATVCRFVGDLRFDPQDRLNKILNNQNVGRMSQMELTYRPVLEYLTVPAGDDESQEELYRNFRAAIGTIVVLAEPLAINSLATLLNVSPRSLGLQLAPLYSVLRVPTDCHAPVRTLHLSFTEFLLNDQTQQPFSIDGPSTHFTLSRHCLRVLSGPDGLRENICNLDYPGQLRHEVESTSITNQLSPVFQYACRYWVHHVQHSGQQIHDLDEVHTFLKEHFLHWLEVLALIDRLSEAVRLVSGLQSCVSDTAVEVQAFLQDARRFILAHRHIIDLAPMQLYSSTVIFTPENSVVRRVCCQEPSWIRQYPRAITEWGLELQTLEGHSDQVVSVAFSPDGSLLASASGDQTVRMWETQTGRTVQTLGGHSDRVYSVAFSPDGSLLALSDDRTVLVWETQTGRTVQTLEGHSDRVYSVAFSPDGLLLASASYDETVRVWETHAGGRTVQTLEGHSNWVHSVAFSPDGSLLASASGDQTVRMWETQTGRTVQTLEGHSNRVYSVAFSPDGSLLASASGDQTVRVWETHAGGRTVQTLEGHSDRVVSVAFSPNGSLLASASYDETVRVWDIQTERTVQTLVGHSDWVHSVAFSPNGSLLASASYDQTVRVWETQTGQPVQTFYDTHTSTVSFTDNTTLIANEVVLSLDTDTAISHRDVRSSAQARLGVSGDWIQQDKQNLLWLPREYRGVATSYGNKLAIGAESGRVSIFEFEIS